MGTLVAFLLDYAGFCLASAMRWLICVSTKLSSFVVLPPVNIQWLEVCFLDYALQYLGASLPSHDISHCLSLDEDFCCQFGILLPSDFCYHLNFFSYQVILIIII